MGGHGFVCASPSCASPRCACGRAEGCCLACEGFGINLAARARCSEASPFSHEVKKTDFRGCEYFVFVRGVNIQFF